MGSEEVCLKMFESVDHQKFPMAEPCVSLLSFGECADDWHAGRTGEAAEPWGVDAVSPWHRAFIVHIVNCTRSRSFFTRLVGPLPSVPRGSGLSQNSFRSILSILVVFFGATLCFISWLFRSPKRLFFFGNFDPRASPSRLGLSKPDDR